MSKEALRPFSLSPLEIHTYKYILFRVLSLISFQHQTKMHALIIYRKYHVDGDKMHIWYRDNKIKKSKIIRKQDNKLTRSCIGK